MKNKMLHYDYAGMPILRDFIRMPNSPLVPSVVPYTPYIPYNPNTSYIPLIFGSLECKEISKDKLSKLNPAKNKMEKNQSTAHQIKRDINLILKIERRYE
ncbi:MAG: hypothetical protein ACP5OG_05410 [Candidatus Nanoarchaeia archaeon]